MLNEILSTIQKNEAALKSKGVLHAGVFGSMARNEAHQGSDIDVVIDLDEAKKISAFDYAAIKEFIAEILKRHVDVVTRKGLKKALRSKVEREEVRAF